MKRPFYHYVTIGIVVLYLIIPLLGTFLYSFATEWNHTVLPEGLSFEWYQRLFSDSRFIDAFIRSLLISLGTTAIAVLIIVPTVCAVILYAPKLEKYIQAITVMTYAIPGIILAVGLIRSYSDFQLSKILIVMGAYFVCVIPYMYQGTRNSLRNINGAALMEAAEVLGASRWGAFRHVIVPNIIPGILVSALLSFSILFGEFVLINMIVGTRFETVQLYLFAQTSKSGHMASAIVVCYFVLMALITALIIKATSSRKTKKRAAPKKTWFKLTLPKKEAVKS
ncbi:ABC transporter permease [Mesobacillus campisalis]|uniref:ABC transporter permease n=1 Tax=Mesobacillus campisalis TaxID=1408103 RepID=A0A0M2T215_9BACI|nr:ABC transporter permease [Mesobacillus campisalis]KKK40016.1 ABC transporter permease [Mesobacillus campisalis]